MAYFSYRNLKKVIKKQDKKFISVYGSLFYEFKNNNGLLSTQYYALFFLRRNIFIFAQIFLNDYPETQLTICIICSFMVIFKQFILYMILYSPFEDRILQTTNLISEIGIALTLFCLSGYFLEQNVEKLEILDDIIIYLVASIMIVLTLGPIFISARSLVQFIKEKMTQNTLKSNKINPLKRVNRNKTKKVLSKLEDSFDAPIVNTPNIQSPEISDIDSSDLTVTSRPNNYYILSNQHQKLQEDTKKSEENVQEFYGKQIEIETIKNESR